MSILIAKLFLRIAYDLQLPKPLLSNANKLRHFKSLIGSDPVIRAKLGSLELSMSENDKVNSNTIEPPTIIHRPVSAPVRRPTSASYVSSLRVKVKDIKKVSNTTAAKDICIYILWLIREMMNMRQAVTKILSLW